ncbi:hypothetical protein LY78DRAFT_674342 [Colletotrichum sublineola]|nr:hypothetical protein LY78DRAFT_674342 [Colletotrichum sublineola]
MRYTTTTLLAIGLLMGSALTVPLPQDDFNPFSNGDGDGGGIATFSGGNPPGKRSPLPLDNSNPLGDCSDLGCIPPESHNKRCPDSLTINSDPLHIGGEAGVGDPPPPNRNGKRSPVPQDDFDPFGDGSDDDPSNPGKRSMTISARKDKSGPVETFRNSNEDDDPADDPNTVHETDSARKRSPIGAIETTHKHEDEIGEDDGPRENDTARKR